LDFFAAKVTRVNLQLGTATVVWDADGDGEWDEDEEEVPLAYLRSATGFEDLAAPSAALAGGPNGAGAAEAVAPGTAASKREERLTKGIEARRAAGEVLANASRPSQTLGPLENKVSVSEGPKEKEKEVYPNELSDLLADLDASDHYASVAALAQGWSLERHVRPLGEQGLIEAGVPRMKARKV
jgi:hypothetical protein